MKTYGRVEVQLHHSWSRLWIDLSGYLHTLRERALCMHWIRDRVDPQKRSGPCGVEKNLLTPS
jgi:hypothetical protein